MYFDSFDEGCKRPFGAAAAGEEMAFSVRVRRREGAVGAEIVFSNDAGDRISHPLVWKGMEDGYDFYGARFNAPEAGLWFYALSFRTAAGERFAGPGRGEILMQAETFLRQLTVYEKGYETPEFLKGGVIYHIFVDRFSRSERHTFQKEGIFFHEDTRDLPVFLPDEEGIIRNIDFFGGSLAGITEKLPYLFELGVTTLYLSPIFEARSNHKYDTGDYEKIDPMFGSLEDFKTLCKKAGELQIRIILDGVFNHTGDDSKYFNKYGRYPSVGAYQSRSSPYYSWYHFQEYPDLYDSWWGLSTLPAVNDGEKSFRDFMTGENGVIRKWLRAGASGWRLDVADELSDGFLDEIRAAAKKEKKDALVLGEVWEDASNKISYGERRRYFSGGQLDAVMNYPLKDAIIGFLKEKNAERLQSVMDSLYENYPKTALDCAMNLLGTHDTARILTVLGEEDLSRYSREEKAKSFLSGEKRRRAVGLLKLASVLQMTLPGVPSVFYGDEAGLEGFEDSFNRRFYPWGREDREILSHYQKLIGIRRELKVLKTGGYECLRAKDGVFLFARTEAEEAAASGGGGGALIVGANLSETPFVALCGGPLTDLWTKKSAGREIKIPPGGFVILKGEEQKSENNAAGRVLKPCADLV